VVALVTGASRGVGRGVSLGLLESGHTVFGTGRTILDADLPAAIVRIPCDHSHAEETRASVARVLDEAGRLDILVTAAWGGYERMVVDGAYTWEAPFWDQQMDRWADMMEAGVQPAYLAAAMAAPPMIRQGSGLMVHISYWAARKHMGNVLYGMAKAATDKMAADMAVELRPHGVAAVALYPGLVRTERVLAAAQWLDLSNSESPQFQGRVIAALARDPHLARKSGRALVAADLALEYGVLDIDGRQPWPLTLDSA